jgi:DNA-binding LacI/PurR family transcriptional regulator
MSRAGDRQGRRATIKDIAERAGVSKGAVSYALNDRPGVSDETRERILAIADELGWYPNRAARALSASRADACGLVLARPATTIALEPFFMEFIAGVEARLSPRSIGLTIQLVNSAEEEIAVYRRWFGEHRVDGVFVVDVRHDDPRVEALRAMGLPAVVIGGPLPGRPLPSVWHDEASAMVDAVRYLGALGHRRIARVAGIAEFAHTQERARAFRDVTHELGLDTEVVSTDYTPESGTRATRRLLSSPDPPTAIIFDSDLLAVTGLGVAQQMGFSVPDDLSLIGWDDSLISRVVHPPLTAITRDIGAYGATAARHLLAVIDGPTRDDVEVARGELTPRGSTAPPRDAVPVHARAALQADAPARVAARSVRKSRALDV